MGRASVNGSSSMPLTLTACSFLGKAEMLLNHVGPSAHDLNCRVFRRPCPP